MCKIQSLQKIIVILTAMLTFHEFAKADETLTGRWPGSKEALEERGIHLEVSLTQFYQGPISTDESKAWYGGGTLDAFLAFDSSKMGLWNGGRLSTHLEYNYGRYNFNPHGVLTPINTALYFPDGDFGDASLTLSQTVGSRLVITAGKINMIDSYDSSHEFSGGKGLNQFQHLEFVAPYTGIVPPMIAGAIFSVSDDGIKYTAIIYDPEERTSQWFEDLFATGMAINGQVEFDRGLVNARGKQVVTAIYSSKDGVDFNAISGMNVPGVVPASKEDRWYFAYSFEQSMSPAEAVDKWGYFGQFAISDGNPNPMRWTLLGGIGGFNPFGGREHDRIGLGVFYIKVSDDLKEALRASASFGDEYGAELFYNYAITKWLLVTADLQILRPGPDNRSVAYIGGLRGQVLF